ncbi:Glycogenin glucosyltransferase [Fasciola hepatica]|uniref:glycogenin glucosyltransferase n=1 Tax=Fasciola hepatica TaxID=6192 RepID=A0A4E0RUE9_FASHE|nr:Glycogenin glucosyltransferase [Fasciola hepatica]
MLDLLHQINWLVARTLQKRAQVGCLRLIRRPLTMSEAFVTLATTDEYACGALVWAHSLREVKTEKQIVCMLTKEVSPHMWEICRSVFDHVELVDVLDSKDEINLALLERPDLGVTFTKLHCWRLTQYQKAVFMDADTLVIQNIDDLFEREELSAAPDPGWPDCFNSGVFVYVPSQETYEKLLKFAMEKGSFDGGDQGLLNLFFHDWATKDIRRHLPFLFNVISQALYSYLPAFTRFRSRIRVVHFIGAEKPWQMDVDQYGNVKAHEDLTSGTREYLQYWWHLFCTRVQPKLVRDASGLIGKLASLEITVPCPPTISVPDENDRQMAWERGQMDYLGSDSFERIQSMLESKIGGSSKS